MLLISNHFSFFNKSSRDNRHTAIHRKGAVGIYADTEIAGCIPRKVYRSPASRACPPIRNPIGSPHAAVSDFKFNGYGV